ncbi:MAG: response regulator [Acidimicrobiales bacterium]|nr:response regulator [Acidimicrobiales bacterium]
MDEITDVMGSKILVVDDEPNNVVLLERLLQREGYKNVTSAVNPRLGLDMVKNDQPDIVLLDLMMPEIDGFSFMEKMANDLGYKTPLPVLVLTADMTPESMRRSMSLGVYDFVTKPFDPDEVMLRVRNILESLRLSRELSNALVALKELEAKLPKLPEEDSSENIIVID